MTTYILLAFIILVSICLIKNKSIFVFYSVFYLIFYAIIPLIWMNFGIEGHFHINIERGTYYLSRLDNLSYTCFFCYIFLLIGYIISKKVVLKRKFNFSYSINNLNKKIYITSIFFFIISFISINMLVFSFGNYITAIPAIINLRWINNTVEIPFSFMRIFNPFIIASFYGFYSLKNTRYANRFLMLITFIISIYFLVLQSGRSHFIYFLFPFFFLMVKNGSRKKIMFCSIILVFITGVLIVFGDDFRRLFLSKEMIGSSFELNDLFNHLVIQLSNPIFNLLSIPENIDKSGYRFGLDFLTFLNLIPSLNIIPLWKINTENFNSENAGIIVDQITFGYYQFNIVGSLLVSFILGIIIRVVENFFKKQKQCIYTLIEGRVILLFISLLQHFDIEAIIRANLSFLLMLFLIKITISGKS